MKKKLLQNLSANTLQLLVNQLCGLIIFFLLSRQLGKTDFGQLNLVLAIMLVVFNLLTLGIDQVIIRKIAIGDNPHPMLSIYLFHVLITGVLFYAILIFSGFLIRPENSIYPLLLIVGAGKLMIYFSTPFKILANGFERFKLLAYMLVTSNLVRSIGLSALALLHLLTLKETIIIFVIGDLLELLVCIFLFQRNIKVPVTFNWRKKDYTLLLTEALPQTGVVLLTSAISRFDWIFIGVIVSSVKLAEYSFAYKVFEISTLPLLAVAPLLLPWFTRLFKENRAVIDKFKFLIRVELIIAAATALILNLAWAPVIDTLTDGKYGTVNTRTVFLLSLCISFLYLNNFLWTIYFAQGRLKMILTAFMITFLVNAGLDILLIPFFNNEGAAAAFLLSCVAQTVYFMCKNQISELKNIWQNLCFCMGCALASGLIAKACFSNTYLIAGSALLLFFVLMLLIKQIRPGDRKLLTLIYRD